MSTRGDAAEQRKLRSVVRRYERDGYRVTVPGRGGGLPAFLGGFKPDLIAESEGDRVVIEVKRSDAVRGSNDLVEIAERVSREPGWRFELVTVASDGQDQVSAGALVGFVEERARQVMGAGHTDAAYVFASAAAEVLLRDLALRHGLKARKMPPAQTVRDLVSRGIISPDVYDRLEQVYSVRGRLLHGRADKEASPTIADVEDLLTLLRHLDGEMAAATAA